jgi:hypothetical protein
MNQIQIERFEQNIFPELNKNNGLKDFMLNQFINRDDGYKERVAVMVLKKVADILDDDPLYTQEYLFPCVNERDDTQLMKLEINYVIKEIVGKYVDDSLKYHLIRCIDTIN